MHAREFRRHVGPLHNGLDPVGDERRCFVRVDLILGGAGNGHVTGDVPRPLALVVFDAEVFGIFPDPASANLLEFHHPGKLVLVETVPVVDESVGVAGGDYPGAQVDEFFDGVLSHVARPRHGTNLPPQAVAPVGQHVLQEVHGSVSRGLAPDQAPAVGQTLAGHDADPAVHDPLVLAEHEADLARSDADVAGGDISILADVTVEFGNQGLAEPHDFTIGLSLGVEVGSAFGAAHGKPRQAVLEDLLEAQKLEDALVDGRVEAHAALVGTDGVVELHAPGPVGPYAPFVILPRYPEDDDPIRLRHPFQDTGFPVFRVLGDVGQHRFSHLPRCLMELGFVRISANEPGHELFQIGLELTQHGSALS